MPKKIKQLLQNLEIRHIKISTYCAVGCCFFSPKRHIKIRNVLIDMIKATLKAMHNFHNIPSYKKNKDSQVGVKT